MCRFLFLLFVSRSGFYLGLLVIVLVLLLASDAWSQDILWFRTYSGTGAAGGSGVCQTSDGGYIAAGETWFQGTPAQVYLVKTDARGDTLWTKTYGGWGWDQGNSVRLTRDGGYIVAGWTTSYGSAIQVYLIKTDSNGDTMWTSTYGGSDWDVGIKGRQTSDGGYIVVGSTRCAPFIWDVYLIKTDSIGQVEWARTYGGTQDEHGYWVEQTSDGGYILAGYTTSFGHPGYHNIYLIKTNSRGDTLWTRAFFPEESFWNLGTSCRQTSDGGYVVTGFSISGQTGDCYVPLIKTDANGNTEWIKMYGGYYLAWAFSVRQTYDGGYIMVGLVEREESGYENDIYVIKTNQEGDTLWTRIFGGSGGDVGYDVQQTSDGSYIVVGATADPYGLSDLYLLKISAFPEPGIRGDANGDGRVTISDVVYLVNYLFRGGPPPQPLTAGDANCDGIVDLGDVIWLLNYLFKGGSKPGYGCE